VRRRLDHYVASRRMLEHELGGHPVVAALAFELEALEALPPSATEQAIALASVLEGLLVKSS